MRRILMLPLVLLPACDGGDTLRVPRDAPPAAAVVAPGMETENLEEQLREMEAELQRARAGEPERLLTAEAISDRLIHATRPVDWLASGYDVEARLRQLQTMADRILARLLRGSTVESVEEDVAAMLSAVQDLQAQLARPGGGSAPPTLDSLLSQDPLRDVEAPSVAGVRAARDSVEADRELPDIDPIVAPVRSGPLGTPIAPPDTTPGG